MINSKPLVAKAQKRTKKPFYTHFRIVNEKVMIVREFVICCCGFYGALIYLIKHNTIDNRASWGRKERSKCELEGGFSQYKC